MGKFDISTADFYASKQIYVDEFLEFLKIPSVSSEPSYRDEVLKCSRWVSNFLLNAGLDVEYWESPFGYPVVFASWLKAGADKPTVLIYNHYDVQPVDPLEKWTSAPFEPRVSGENIFARGAQDNKGQCYYVMAAVRFMLEKYGELPVNLKLVIEGEEETGSVAISKLLEVKAEKLKADHLFVVDVGFEKKDEPAITLGLRGNIALSLEATGSKTDLHSGMFGGIAYNPNRALVELLASAYDKRTGKIAIPGFYEDVVSPDQEFLSALDFSLDIKTLEREQGIRPGGGELGAAPLESNWLNPTLEICGIGGGYTGPGFKTVIPATSVAKVSCRLVPNQDPEKITELVANYFREKTPEGIKLIVTTRKGGPAVRTSVKSKVVQAAAKAFAEVNNKECKFILCGASIPVVADLAKVSGSEVVLIGYGLPDDLIHAPNENFSIDRLAKGFATIGRMLEILAD